MKRILLPGYVQLINAVLLFFLVSTFGLMPQSSVAQTEKFDFQVAEEFGLSDGQILELDFVTNQRQVTTADIVVGGEEYEFELHPHSVRSSNFVLREQLADGSYVERTPEPPLTVKGALRGNKGSRVVGSMIGGGLAAKIVMADGQVFFLEPISSKIDDEQFNRKHVLYQSRDTKPHPGFCGVGGELKSIESVRFANERKERIAQLSNASGKNDGDGPSPNGGSSGIQIAELAVDADFEYFNDYGTVQATLNRMEFIVNVVNDQYETEVEISHEISAAIVRSTVNDPYSSSDSLTLLTQFRNEWLGNQQGVQRDVAHLFTGRSINGGVIGRAWTIGGICTTSSYCFSESDYNGNFGCATALTAHELGHLWNGSHCDCVNHTMNPFNTCENTFNPTFTIPSIVAHRNSRTCLSSAAPDNDDWEAAVAVGSLPAMVVGSNENATTQGDEQDLDNTGSSVWWSAVAPGNGIMRVSTIGSNFDTQLRIYTGDALADLQSLAFDDDANGTNQSEITFPVDSGQRYEIRVGGFTNGGVVSQGDIELSVSFMAQGPTQFFWSNRELDSGAVNDSNPGITLSEGGTGSIYLYFDPSTTELDTGAFVDIAASVPGVIEFTGAEAFDFDITVSGTPFNLRWGDASGATGDVGADFIEGLGALTVVSGTGMVNENTGPMFFDEGYDASVGAFLFARVDFNVVGAAGSLSLIHI